jgi:hypothetical protein
VEREELLLELQALPEKVLQAEQAYVKALSYLEDTRLALNAKTNELLLDGTIQGRNEQTREAELWPHTYELRRLTLKAKLAVEQTRSELSYVKNQLETMKLIAQLLLQAPQPEPAYVNWSEGPMD